MSRCAAPGHPGQPRRDATLRDLVRSNLASATRGHRACLEDAFVALTACGRKLPPEVDA